MTEIDSQGGDAVKSVAFNPMNEEVPTLNQILQMVEKNVPMTRLTKLEINYGEY